MSLFISDLSFGVFTSSHILSSSFSFLFIVSVLDLQINMLESVYGKSVSLHDAATKKSQIIESAAMLNLQQEQQRQQQQQSLQKNGSNSVLTPSKNSNMSASSYIMSAGGDNTPFKVRNAHHYA